MAPLLTATGADGLAIGLASLGALLFGLAAVRQHRAVTESALRTGGTGRERVAAGLRLLGRPAWLLGAGQAGLGGALHVVALTLAPVTLVQPVGVLAVPVTVVTSALARRRRPARTDVVGTVLSVVGVAALTLVLLTPAGSAAATSAGPRWTTLATGAAVVLGGAAVVALGLRRAPAAVRCVARAVVAAVLFGLVSVLVRALGTILTGPDPAAAVVTTALVGIALALPLGVWAMQSAYVVGAPQVVICCLTLADPLTAVVAGRVLLGDGAAVTGPTWLAAAGCAAVAAAGVVLLSARPVAAGEAPAQADSEKTGAPRAAASTSTPRPGPPGSEPTPSTERGR